MPPRRASFHPSGSAPGTGGPCCCPLLFNEEAPAKHMPFPRKNACRTSRPMLNRASVFHASIPSSSWILHAPLFPNRSSADTRHSWPGQNPPLPPRAPPLTSAFHRPTPDSFFVANFLASCVLSLPSSNSPCIDQYQACTTTHPIRLVWQASHASWPDISP